MRILKEKARAINKSFLNHQTFIHEKEIEKQKQRKQQ